MKKIAFFIFLLWAAFAHATPPDTLQTFATEAAAVQGFQKSAARYTDKSGQSRAVVCDNAGNVFFVAYSCKRGYYRVLLDKGAVASAD